MVTARIHTVAALELPGLHTVAGLRELDHVAQVLGRTQPADGVLAWLGLGLGLGLELGLELG